MSRSHARASHRPAERGFTIIELIVVAGIIALMVGVSIPAVSKYIRNYRLRAAAEQLTTEMSTARMTAIRRNVNLGVVFVVHSNTDYQLATEDDLNPTVAGLPNWSIVGDETWDNLFDATLDPVQFGIRRSLPSGVEFDPACSNQTGDKAAAAPNTIGFRFNRIGGWCGFGLPAADPAACPAVPGAPTDPKFVFSDPAGTGSTICLIDPRTTVTRWVSVAMGGRVQTH